MAKKSSKAHAYCFVHDNTLQNQNKITMKF